LGYALSYVAPAAPPKPAAFPFLPYQVRFEVDVKAAGVDRRGVHLARLDRRHELVDACNVVRDLELLLAPGVRHVPDLSEDGTLLPALVVHPHDGPHAPHISAGVATVQLVRVVQVDGELERLVRTRGVEADGRKPKTRGCV